MPEYVYILTNPAMPAWVKIGRADDMRQRIAELSRETGVPFAFQEYAHLEVADSQKMESILHDMIKNDYKKRRSINEITMREKEFFELSAEEAYAIFQKVEALVASQGGKAKLVKTEPNAEEIAAQESANQAIIRSGRDPGVWLKRLGITDGAELTCTKKDKDGNVLTVKAVHCSYGVWGENNGTEKSLLGFLRDIYGATKSAEKFLTDAFNADKAAMGEELYAIGNVSTAVTRSLWFWKYQDRTLLEIYADCLAKEQGEPEE